MMTATRRFLAPLLGLLLLSGCVREPPNLSLLPADELYQEARTAYEAGQYARAIEYFEAFVENNIGDPRAPEARYLLAESHSARRDHLSAVLHYQRLINDFPASELQLDARFGICESYYDLSPRPALDQEYTYSAILHCESVAQYYPDTEEAEQATQYVAELREKLAKKEYDTGMHYMRRRAFDAAVIYFQDVVDLYPGTSYAPRALARMVEAYGNMGYVEDAAEARERLLADYPESAEAQAMRDGASS